MSEDCSEPRQHISDAALSAWPESLQNSEWVGRQLDSTGLMLVTVEEWYEVNREAGSQRWPYTQALQETVAELGAQLAQKEAYIAMLESQFNHVLGRINERVKYAPTRCAGTS